MSRLYLSLIFLFLCHALSGQTRTAFIKAGDKAYELNDFFTSAYHYKSALEYDSTDVSVGFKYAQASRRSNSYSEALKWYRKAYLDKDKFPEAVFFLAEMLKTKMQYEEAGSLFKEYYETNKSKETEYTKRALIEVKACNNANKIISDSISVNLKKETVLNSTASDFGASSVDSVIYLSSFRENNISQIYMKLPNEPKPSKLPETINNSEFSNGNSTITPDGNKIYFSRCKINEKTGKNECEIFQSTKKGKKWTEAKPVKGLNKEGFSSTQPSISKLNEKQFVLYYSSDKPGGAGGLDIWYAIMDLTGKVSEQGNIGKDVNTPSDDICPFYHLTSQTLYFSSNWHPGLGLYDIFKSQGNKNKWSSPQNIGYPFNSSCNDLYFKLDSKLPETGFLTSNRADAYNDAETCCNDIFSFSPVEKKKAIDSLKKEIIITPLEVKEPEESLTKEAVVYFHNDEPNPRSLAETTLLSYEDCYNSYLKIKPAYFKEFSGKGEEPIKEDLQEFFELVGEQLENLHELTEYLKIKMEKGKKITLSLKGYCSPLNNTQYNVHLAKRRITSVKNSFQKAGLGKYIENGNLIILEEVLGESKAKANVSDKLEDKKNSVFNPNAARERWVEISIKSIE